MKKAAVIAVPSEAALGYGAFAAACYRERLMGRLALDPVKRGRALDLGCGEGQEALYLAGLGYQVDAVDREPRPQWASVARTSQGRVRFRQGDAARLTGLRPGYDLVFEKDMLHHAADPAGALAEMARLTRPGGRVLALEANRLNPVFYLHLTLLGDHQHFTRRRFAALLEQGGLRGVLLSRIEARVWPVNRPRIQRLIQRVEDLAERLPPLRSFLCYHAADWRKDAR